MHGVTVKIRSSTNSLTNNVYSQKVGGHVPLSSHAHGHRYHSYRQTGSGRRQSARTVENVDTVNDLDLSHKGALKCIKPRVKLQERPAFITRQCTALFSAHR